MRTNTQKLFTNNKGLRDNNRKNIMNTCRLCMLIGSARMEPIFEEYIRANRSSSIAEKIAGVTQLNLCEGDGLPAVVCQQCLFQLDVADTFIQRCKQSDTSLRALLMQGEGTKGSSKRDSQSVASVTTPTASGADFSRTDQSFETATNSETVSKEENPTKKAPSKNKLIPPALSSNCHPFSGNDGLTEIPANVVSKHTGIPVDNVKACKDKEVFQASKSQQPKTNKSLLHSIPCDNKRFIADNVKTHDDKINGPAKLSTINTPSPMSQSLVVDANPTIAAEADSGTSNSEFRARSASSISPRLRDSRLAKSPANVTWKCSGCGVLIDQKTASSRHLCCFLTFPWQKDGRQSPVQFRHMDSVTQGQLHQLRCEPRVVLVRTSVPGAKEGSKPGESGTNPVGEQPVSTPCEDQPVTNKWKRKRRGLVWPYAETNYLVKRQKSKLLKEVIELRTMQQRLKARLQMVDNGGRGGAESLKLTQLKQRLRAKLEQPMTVVCSPDLFIPPVLTNNECSNADPLPFECIKVEPCPEVEAHVNEPLVGSKRTLPSHDVSTTSADDGFLENVKTEPESEEDQPEQPGVGARNRNDRCHKKTRLKLQR